MTSYLWYFTHTHTHTCTYTHPHTWTHTHAYTHTHTHTHTHGHMDTHTHYMNTHMLNKYTYAYYIQKFINLSVKTVTKHHVLYHHK